MQQEPLPSKRYSKDNHSLEYTKATSTTSENIFRKFRFIHFYSADTILDKYEFLDQIGSGSYGIVMKARSKSNDEIVAIKLVKKFSANDNSQLEDEVNNLISLDHPNIIKLLEVYHNEQYLFLVQEYCACSFIDFVRKHKINEEGLRVIVKQLLSALHYCHKIGVIHRDVKIQNVMFADRDDITSLKLIDFGLSGRISAGANYQAMGTAIYLAPEMIIGEYDEKVDLWSLGILIYYALNGVPPFQGKTTRELYQNIVQGSGINYVPKIAGASPELNDLLSKLLKYNKAERISAENAIKHIWILLRQDTNKSIVKELFLNKFLTFITKNKFLKLLVFQFSTRWKDSFCKPLKEALEAIDSDHDGIISISEFLEAIEAFNKMIGSRIFSRQEAESIFAALDFNSNGQIDYLEFQTLFASQVLFTDEKTLYNEFKRMDLNGDGVIDRGEIKKQLSKYENDITDSVICQFMGDFDTKKYGGITFSELKKTVRTYSESAMD